MNAFWALTLLYAWLFIAISVLTYHDDGKPFPTWWVFLLSALFGLALLVGASMLASFLTINALQQIGITP